MEGTHGFWCVLCSEDGKWCSISGKPMSYLMSYIAVLGQWVTILSYLVSSSSRLAYITFSSSLQYQAFDPRRK